ncbi:hypothetical protein F4818DRAFT_436013 [Hypoxylon cercidicola]|nr:hypothetical protein F4818DRAFT_436013 [Hypoxylon cercidicola]
MLVGRLGRILAVVLTVVTAVEAAADVNKFFSRYWPNRDTDNGCKAHAKDLDDSYKEASKLIDAAVDAIAYLKTNKKPGALKLKDRWNWDRQAQAMLSMFGIKISSKNGGPLDESRDNFEFVEKIFGQMQDGMKHDQLSMRAPPGLYCGVKAWKYYKPDASNPLDPTKKISDEKLFDGKPRWPRGYWYFNGNRVMNPDQTPEKHNFCGDNVYAFTIAQLTIITFCDYIWESNNVVKTLNVDMVKEYDHLMAKERNSLSVTWVHELAHFYGSYPNGGLPDQPAVDQNGKQVKDSKGNPVKTYGTMYVLNLAKADADRASRTADAFALFALAM